MSVSSDLNKKIQQLPAKQRSNWTRPQFLHLCVTSWCLVSRSELPNWFFRTTRTGEIYPTFKRLVSCSVQWPQTGMASPWVKENWSWITRRNPTLSPCKLSTHCCCWSIVLHPLLIRWRPYCPRVCCSSELFVAVPLQSFRHPESESSADMLMKIPGKGQY